MKKSFIALSLLAALASVNTAKAEVLDVSFSGVVQSQIGTGAALNSAVSGFFLYDTTLSAFTKFVIGGQSVADGFASQADLSPDSYTALYTAQLSPVAVGGDLNSTFSLDLEAKNSPWSASSAIALLKSPELATNLDASSTFTYYNANSNGSNLKTLTASLTSVQVSVVPEPASLMLMLAGVAAVGAVVRRRQAV